jgi:hypothetical protein
MTTGPRLPGDRLHQAVPAHRVMAALNAAYAVGDADAIQRILEP